MLVPGFAFPVEPGPMPGDGVVVPGCVADGAGFELGVLLPEPVAGALPVPVLPPLLCASAGAVIAATIARVARLLMTRDAIACVLLGAIRSLPIGDFSVNPEESPCSAMPLPKCSPPLLGPGIG